MELYVNNEKMDITLEKEKKLSEVLDSVEVQVKKSGAVIVSTLVNGKSIDYSDASWKELPIPSIQTLHLEADTPYIARLKLLGTCETYLRLLYSFNHKELDEEEGKKKEEFLKESTLVHDLYQIQNTIDSISLGFRPLNFPLRTILNKSFHLLGLLDKKPHIQYSQEADELLQQCIDLLQERRERLLDLDSYWLDISKTVIQQISELQVFTQNIHNSEEGAVRKTIGNYIDFIQLWIHVLQNPPSYCTDVPLWKQLCDEITKKIVSLWEELHRAIESKDWVSVADTIEYDIGPLVKDYARRLLDEFSPKTKKN